MKVHFLYAKHTIDVFVGDLFNTLKVNSFPKVCQILYMFSHSMGKGDNSLPVSAKQTASFQFTL